LQEKKSEAAKEAEDGEDRNTEAARKSRKKYLKKITLLNETRI
jgi:hypothetical protein